MRLDLCYVRSTFLRHARSFGTLPQTREHLPKHGERVIVAMSGGVDSSVTAALLAQSPRSYNLSAIFMRNWDTRDETGEDKVARCEWKQDWEDVQSVAQKLGIPCKMIDLSRHYWNRVFEPALDVWREGRTPNPDISCNKEIKFGALLDHPELKGAWLATGHYAHVDLYEGDDSELHPRLLRGIQETKDQSYWLSSVSSQKLRKAFFPLGNLTKPEVREIAVKHGLSTAHKRESMGICFVGKKKSFSTFLDSYLPSNPGDVVTPSGKILARHSGLWTYTIGQNARISGLPKRMFVCAKNKERNEIIVVDDPDHPLLKRNSVTIENLHWVWESHPPAQVFEEGGFQVTVKFRSVMQPTNATIFMSTKTSGQVVFQEPQQGVAAGQVVVLYQGNWCLGGGTIVEE